MEKPLIWIAEPEGFSEEALQLLQNHASLHLEAPNEIDLTTVFDRCDAFLFRLGYRISESHVRADQRCKILVTPVTGTDHIDETACQKCSIQLISLKGEREFLSKIRATGEHTLALMFALSRKLFPAVKHVKEKHFSRDMFQGTELYGKTLGIIGYGRLGSMVAQYGLALGMHVVAHDIHQEKEDLASGVLFTDVEHLLSISDFVSVHIDFHKGNVHWMDRHFFAKMKPTAFFINTSRGGVVKEGDLVYALENGLIAGAALDVVEGEPMVDFESELHRFNRVSDRLIITPHIGGNTQESFEKTEMFIAQKLIKALQNA